MSPVQFLSAVSLWAGYYRRPSLSVAGAACVPRMGPWGCSREPPSLRVWEPCSLWGRGSRLAERCSDCSDNSWCVSRSRPKDAWCRARSEAWLCVGVSRGCLHPLCGPGASRAFPVLLLPGRQTALCLLLGVVYPECECKHNYTANTLPANESICSPPLLGLPSNLYLCLFVLALYFFKGSCP